LDAIRKKYREMILDGAQLVIGYFALIELSMEIRVIQHQENGDGYKNLNNKEKKTSTP
jgi:hypothetical protein